MRIACRPKALALGATIALGSCQLAACDAGGPGKGREVLSTLAPAPEVPETVEEMDLESDDARLADVSTSPGFTPDPQTFQGTTSGGPIDVEDVDERCHGWVARAPDAILRAPRPFAELVIMASSRADLTLTVVDDGGELRCGDDEDGSHPIVRGYFGRGTYRVWVGTAEPDVQAPFTLALSELDDSLPSSLPN